MPRTRERIWGGWWPHGQQSCEKQLQVFVSCVINPTLLARVQMNTINHQRQCWSIDLGQTRQESLLTLSIFSIFWLSLEIPPKTCPVSLDSPLPLFDACCSVGQSSWKHHLVLPELHQLRRNAVTREMERLVVSVRFNPLGQWKSFDDVLSCENLTCSTTSRWKEQLTVSSSKLNTVWCSCRSPSTVTHHPLVSFGCPRSRLQV